jgi:hypothetical protein
VLHPVGKLPAAVYWRRRLLVLTVLVVVLGGAGWLTVALVRGDIGGASTDTASSVVPVPRLERVVPSWPAIATPTPPVLTPAQAAAPTTAAVPDPVAGGPCTDEMVALEVRTPGTVAVGSKPTFELVVSNVSAVPCVRALDKGLQEFVLLDLAGNRIWGSNDCFPEASSDPRTLAPGEVVSLAVTWGGLTSEPTCTAARGTPSPGSYVVRGRLDTKVSADAPLTLS